MGGGASRRADGHKPAKAAVAVAAGTRVQLQDTESPTAARARCFAEEAKYASATPALISVSPPVSSPYTLEPVNTFPASALSEEELQEVVAAFESARALGLRTANISSLQRLAQLGTVEKYCAGSVLHGHLTWTTGWCLVLTGEASIVLEADGAEVVVARLQRGDSFGSRDGEDEAACAALRKCRPRIDVSRDQALRVCRLDWDQPPATLTPGAAESLHAISGNFRRMARAASKRSVISDHLPEAVQSDISQMLGAAGRDLGGLSEWLAGLWLSASPPPVGIGCLPGGLLRSHFLAALWAPFSVQLDQHKGEIQSRKARGYRIHDCFPLQGHQIVELRDHLFHLTEVWYGTARGGNLSALYRWFMEAMQLLGVTAYNFEFIPQEVTADGWAVAVDGVARATALKEKGSSDASYVAAGGVKQRQGRSAIDNTVLSNCFLPQEALQLLVGRRLRKVICRFLAIRQKCVLRRLSEWLHMDLVYLASGSSTARGHEVVRTVLGNLAPSNLEAAGLHPDNLCLRALRSRGAVIAGFGQLERSDQLAVADEVRRLLSASHGDGSPPDANGDDVFERLVAWCRDRPGEFFEGNKRRHLEVKVMGLLASRVIIVKRSAMERFALARYFPLSWKRTQPLWGVFASGPFKVRPADMPEASNVRANECPYAKLHGMSLSAGGFASDQRLGGRKARTNRYSLIMELQWVRDPSANVENWFLTDIEKILQEAWQLNPHGDKAMMLPGEMFVNVGQNPKVGSSIRETQHTQLCEGSLESYPLLQMALNPRFSQKLGAFVDFVEVGLVGAPSEQCCLILRLGTERPTNPALVEFLVGLRLQLLGTFGGGEAIDFLVLAVGDGRGGFSVLFAPIPQLLKIGDEKPDFATWANPMTGESSESAGLEEARVDFGKGVGQFLVLKPELREQLLAGGEDLMRRLWAFNRVPGVRAAIEGFMQEHRTFG